MKDKILDWIGVCVSATLIIFLLIIIKIDK